jgi:hypothetical protein
MADNVTVTNQKTTFDANTNSDIGVRSIESVASAGKQVQVVTSGFAIPDYDYIGATYPTAVQEVYVYKTGGSGGVTVATLTIDYIDSSKANISAVTKS